MDMLEHESRINQLTGNLMGGTDAAAIRCGQ
jgi:hypothetical protein